MSFSHWASAIIALAFLSDGARAEDYCDTSGIDKGLSQSRQAFEIAERAIRAKCKLGDVIWVDGGLNVAKLCDLHQAVVSAGSLGAGFICLLAPPRKTY